MQLLSDAIARARRFLVGRAGAYRRVFNIQSVDAQVVLADLARFCRAHQSTAGSERLDGRREVWLRLQHHLELDSETLWRLYDGRVAPKED